MVDQPEISRAEERKKCAMLIAPKGSKGWRADSSSELWERNRRIASVSVVDEVEEVAEVSWRCAHDAAEVAFQAASEQGNECLISRWESSLGIERN